MSELEKILGFKAMLCQEFAGDNLKLMQSLYEGDSLIYRVNYGTLESDLILDNTREFPLDMTEYKSLAKEAYNLDGREFIEMDYLCE